MAGPIVPAAKALYLCEGVHAQDGVANLYGLFHDIRADGFPYHHEEFVCFAQLLGGLGDVPYHFDVRRASDLGLVDWSGTQRARFADRDTVTQVHHTFEWCEFPTAGVYRVELSCDTVWVADTAVRVWEEQ